MHGTVPLAIMQRLTLVRYLFSTGLDQSQKGEPVAALSILTLHDAIEMFLQAAVEFRQAPIEKNPQFISYWSALEKVGVHLGQKHVMERFNKARVSLKHSGTIPSIISVEEFKVGVIQFLNDSCKISFNIEFSDVSLSNLVKDAEVRSLLKSAEGQLNAGDLRGSLEATAKAFRLSINRHRSNGKIELGRRLYDPWDRSQSSSMDFRLGPEIGRNAARTISEAFQRMGNTFSEAITVLAYKLDYDGYRHLITYGPVLHELVGGSFNVEWLHDSTDDRALVERCLAFSIDAAMRLQG